MKKLLIPAILAVTVLSGCASLSDCDKYRHNRYAYDDCIRDVNAQNSAASAVAGAVLGVVVGAAAAASTQPTYYYRPSVTTTCIGDRHFASCTTH
jgi:hypothetical protein